MLFPAFSKLNPQKDKETLLKCLPVLNQIRLTSRSASGGAGYVSSSTSSFYLFGKTYSTAPLFLALLAITYVFAAFGSLSTGNFISSQGKTTFTLYLTLITAAIGFPMGYILIMQFGVLGLDCNFHSNWDSHNCHIALLDKKTLRADCRLASRQQKFCLSSAIAAALTYLLISELGFSSWIRLIIGIVFFTFVFVMTALLTKTINKSDIGNLRGMVSGMGAVGKVSNNILNIVEKLINILKT